MSKNNPIVRIEFFRWKARTDYAILIERKHTSRVYQNISKDRAKLVLSTCAGNLHNTENSNTGSAVWAVYKPFPRKVQPLTVYFVQVGMDGYLPDSTSAYPTLSQAIQAAKAEKEFDLIGFDYCKVSGDIKRDHCYVTYLCGDYHHSIRIVSESAESCARYNNFALGNCRVGLEILCDWLNDHSF